ncbi:GTPase family protein [Pararhodobacter oceanensis]|uniref:GTPase family protein n=1 Tax=Pararhodobacter oceanensis TaxID=2172121 RepID=UPI003A95D2CF
MTLGARLRRRLLRWNRVALALAMALPLIVSMALGFLWLHEHGWLLYFVLASAALYAVLRAAVWLAQWRGQGVTGERELTGPPPDPEWSKTERAVFERARARISTRLSAPIPWPDLTAEALAVVEGIAADMSDGKRSALDFTVPEALLLIDRVALQYRAFLLENVPYSDRLSVRTMHWAWRKQETAQAAWNTGFLAWRGLRLVLNPAMGLLREAERALAAGLQDRLTVRFRRDAQAILLEEAAQAAIDLYSGRLRASDADLARVAVAGHQRDLALAAPVDSPLRVVVVGQKGAGKSSLINAMLDDDLAEVDAVSTQGRALAFEGTMGETPLRMIDTPGLDGSAARQKTLLREMLAADIVLWVHRATRPGRAADATLMAALQEALRGLPERRPPVVLHLASGVDQLLPDWPRVENRLTAADHALVERAMQAIAAPLGSVPVLPLSLAPPMWNLDALRDRLTAILPEARQVQRGRLRVAASDRSGLRGNAKRAGRGMRSAARTVIGRIRK